MGRPPDIRRKGILMSTQFHVDTQAIATGAADVHRISATIATERAAMMARLMTLE